MEPRFHTLQADSLPTEPPGNQLSVNILGMIYAESKIFVNLGCWPIAHILNQEYSMMLFSYCLTTLYSNQSMEVRVILSQLQTHSWISPSSTKGIGLLVWKSLCAGVKTLNFPLRATTVFLSNWKQALPMTYHYIISLFYIIIYLFIYKWRIIALQYCIGFYQTLAWISHRFTHVPSHLSIPPTFLPIPQL